MDVFKLNNNNHISVILNDNPAKILTKYFIGNENGAIKYGKRAVTHNLQGNNTRPVKNKKLNDNQYKIYLDDLINKIKSIPSYYDLCNHNCKHVTKELYQYTINKSIANPFIF